METEQLKGSRMPESQTTTWLRSEEPWITRLADKVFGHDIFISYSHQDGTQLPRSLKAALQKLNFRVFLDLNDYVPGMDLGHETTRQVRRSAQMVVLVRPAALTSAWVTREVEAAVHMKKWPVLINVNRSLEAGGAASPLARWSKTGNWLRLDETAPSLDEPVSERVISELVRGFRYLRQEVFRRRLVVSVVVVLLASTVVAVWQAIEARNRRIEAERNLSVALKAADTMVVDIVRGLKDVEGIKAASVDKVLSNVEQAYGSIAERLRGDRRFDRGRVAMYNEFVEAYLGLGETRKAVSASASGVSIARNLVTTDQGDRESARALGLALIKRGDAEIEIDNLEAARASYSEARVLRERLAADSSGDLVAQREVGISWMRLVDLDEQAKDWRGALSKLQYVLPMRERLALSKPAWKRDIGVTQVRIVDIALGLGDINLARQHAEGAARVFNELQLADASSTKALKDHAVALQRLGNVLQTSGQYDAARRAYTASREQFTVLERLDPERLEWQRDSLVAAGKLAELDLKDGRLTEAKAALRDLVSRRQALLGRSPQTAQYRSDLQEAQEMLRQVESSLKSPPTSVRLAQ